MLKRFFVPFLLALFFSVSVFSAEGDTSAFTVPVTPSLWYSISQALLSSLGMDIQAETSSREILDRYAESQIVPSGIPSNLTFQTWEAANGDISTFLQLRAAEFRAFWGVLSGLLGLSTAEADELYSSGQTVPVAASSVDLGRDIYIDGQYYIMGSLLEPLENVYRYYSVDFLGTPVFTYIDIPASGYVEKTVGLSPDTYTFRLYDTGICYYILFGTENRYIELTSDYYTGIYYVYDAYRNELNLGYHYKNRPNQLYIYGQESRFRWSTDIVGSTLVNSAPTGLSIDTPVNNWDTVNDDAGYYLSLGQAGTTADSISDSVISTLSQTGTLTREGTYADSLSDAVGELDTPTDIPSVPDLPQGLPDLGALLITRFPFSIPWDFARVFTLLSAEPETPKFSFNLMPFMQRFGVSASGTTVNIDFSDYEIVGTVSRWATFLGFALALIFATKRLIWPS